MPETIVSITDFDAEPSAGLQTEKIQNAVDFCFRNGGGEVRVPEGVFLTGGIRLRSDVTLHLMKNAVLRGSRNPEDYFGYLADKIEPLPPEMITDGPCGRVEFDQSPDYRFMRIPGSRWNNALIRAVNAENVAIIGEEGAILDGADCYDEQGEEHYRGPHCINMHRCRNIILEGYAVKDSANWAHALFYCENIVARNLSAHAGHDGFHMTGCSNVKITDCEFYTGDDCVAGFANLNVLVKNCVLNSACSALRFGGTNVLVEKCRMYGPCRHLYRGSLTVEEKKNGAEPALAGHRDNMLSAFTYYADYSFPIEYPPGNIVIADCRIENADRLLHFNYSGNEPWQQNRPLESIRFERLAATGIAMPLVAYGDEKTPVAVEIRNARIAFRDGCEQASLMHVCNYARITLDHVAVANRRGSPLIKTWSDGKIELEHLECDSPADPSVAGAEDEFRCGAI